MTILLESRLRANPGYELLLREQVADCDVASLPIPRAGEALYGYLRPKPSLSLPWRAVSPDTALLFLSLRQGGSVPDYFRASSGDRAGSRLVPLVLDGVLEVEIDGAFVSGPAARRALLGDEPYAGKGLLATLSVEALRYGEALGELTIADMTRRLYGFGRRPVSPAQRRALLQAGDAAFDPFQDEESRALRNYWTLSPASNAHWMMWRPIWNNDDRESERFKLYVSPELPHVAEAFAAAVEILGRGAGVRGMKLGRGISGVTRPDKLIAYFSRLDDLQEAGAALSRRLEGCPAHGVPFTAALSPDGLLSWGADPRRTIVGQPESWRLWIAWRLATHLETGRAHAPSGPRWQFALDRLRLDGVDPESWAPTWEFLSTTAPGR